jgi:hypothetical protein
VNFTASILEEEEEEEVMNSEGNVEICQYLRNTIEESSM